MTIQFLPLNLTIPNFAVRTPGSQYWPKSGGPELGPKMYQSQDKRLEITVPMLPHVTVKGDEDDDDADALPAQFISLPS